MNDDAIRFLAILVVVAAVVWFIRDRFRSADPIPWPADQPPPPGTIAIGVAGGTILFRSYEAFERFMFKLVEGGKFGEFAASVGVMTVLAAQIGYHISLPRLREASAACDARLGPESRDSIAICAALADACRAAEQSDEEVVLRRRLLAHAEKNTAGQPAEAAARAALGRALLCAGHLAEAEPFLREAVARLDAGSPAPPQIVPLRRLAACLVAQERFAEAEPFARRALAIAEQFFGEEMPIVAMRLEDLARITGALGQAEEAKALAGRAEAAFAARGGPTARAEAAATEAAEDR